jgi:hypothetical protein
MVNGAPNLRPTSIDLGLQERDPLLELLDRIRIEILLCQLRNKVILATRKIFVGVHEFATSASAGAMSIRLAAGNRPPSRLSAPCAAGDAPGFFDE